MSNAYRVTLTWSGVVHTKSAVEAIRKLAHDILPEGENEEMSVHVEDVGSEPPLYMSAGTDSSYRTITG